jgi:hypothetical protein
VVIPKNILFSGFGHHSYAVMGDSLNQLRTFYSVVVSDLAGFCCRFFEGTFSVLDEW